jgi:hypothetical protein
MSFPRPMNIALPEEPLSRGLLHVAAESLLESIGNALEFSASEFPATLAYLPE